MLCAIFFGRVAKNWPNSPESRAKSWEDHSTAAQSRLVSALRDGAPQSGKETPLSPARFQT